MLVTDASSLLNTTPWLLVAGGSAIVLWYVACSFRQPTGSRKIHSLNTALPIVGDALEALRFSDVRHDWITAKCVAFNFEPWQIRIPAMRPLLVVTSPAAVDAIMNSQFDNFIKGAKQIDLLQDLFGDGLLSCDGERWYHQRKTAAKFFSAKTLRLMMTQTMQTNMKQVYRALDSKCDGATLVDLTLLIHQYTMQTFVEVGVGIEFPLIGREDYHPFEKASDDGSPVIARRVMVPPFVWKLERWLTVGPERVLADAMKVIKAHAMTMISQSLTRCAAKCSEPDPSGESIRSAVDLFVEHSSEDKVGIRSQDMVDFVLTFVLAARDSSALTTLWLLYALSKHPRVEAKIRAEMEVELGARGEDDAYITADEAKKLVYLEATIKETLRLYPAAPMTLREAVDDTMVDGDIFVRKGDTVALSVYAMARNPNVWGPDAADFKPERWIDVDTRRLITVPSAKFPTFGAGPRTCIGMKLAMMSLRVLTANLLNRYTFEIDPTNDGSYRNAPALLMKHNLQAKVCRR